MARVAVGAAVGRPPGETRLLPCAAANAASRSRASRTTETRRMYALLVERETPRSLLRLRLTRRKPPRYRNCAVRPIVRRHGSRLTVSRRTDTLWRGVCRERGTARADADAGAGPADPGHHRREARGGRRPLP